MVDTKHTVTERRRAPRARALLSGKIVYGVREEFSVDCVVRNVSAGGCVIGVKSAAVPDQFRLLMFKTGEVHDGTVVWRKPDSVGVKLTHLAKLAETDDKSFAHLRYLWVDATQR